MLLVKNILDNRGSLYVWLLITMLVFLPLMGMVVDFSILYILKNQVQSALDRAGTSALSSSISLEVMQKGEGLRVNREQVENSFIHLLRLNLDLGENLESKGLNPIFQGLEILQLDVQEGDIPKLEVLVQVSYPTLILHYIEPKVNLKVYSQSILEPKGI